MANLEVNIDGLNDLLNILEALPQQIKDRVQQSMNVILVEAIEESRANAPVLTGDLRESITGEVQVDGDDISMIVTADVPYATKTHEAFYNLGPVSSQQPMTPSGGVGRKYIERVFAYYLTQWQERIAKTIVEGK